MTTNKTQEIKIEWKSPSNLAIVKYWGKKKVQKPLNPSISFSLKNAITTTSVSAKPSTQGGFTFYLDSIKKETFNEKIDNLLKIASSKLPFIANHHLTIESSNTFPHSSGIASSASSMSALALCLADLQLIINNEASSKLDLQMVSELARLGSGSAARSLYGGWTIWGEISAIPNSSDDYAIKLPNVHSNFMQIANAILIIEPKSKKVSSSEGHALMNNHPYGAARIKQANDNALQLLEVLKWGDWNQFFDIAENEALSLHALMMSSNPGYTLLHPNSLKVIEEVRRARIENKLPVGFSMDAGPNVHLLYPKYEETKILPWIEDKIRPLCHQQEIIYDELGNGPEKIDIREL
ncbi:MAG TPA: diphosphomevalonate decarboxylase [Marinilabiliaceae bacterium]|nr:diphosphomevalonate decarboxylase [Marinilabiliaceae bacterium]